MLKVGILVFFLILDSFQSSTIEYIARCEFFINAFYYVEEFLSISSSLSVCFLVMKGFCQMYFFSVIIQMIMCVFPPLF